MTNAIVLAEAKEALTDTRITSNGQWRIALREIEQSDLSYEGILAAQSLFTTAQAEAERYLRESRH